jgi:hypothetical protein
LESIPGRLKSLKIWALVCIARRKLSYDIFYERQPPLVDQILWREGFVVGLITKGIYLALVSERRSVMRGSHN